MPVLGQCTSTEHLTICKDTLGTEAAGKLVASLGDPAGLVLLNRSRNVIKAKNVEQLALALAQCSALTHLELGFNQIGDDVGAVAEECGSLRLLDLGKNGIGPGGCGRLGRALIQHASALTHLDLARNQLHAQGADMLASAIGQCTSLTHLDLSFNKIGGQAAGRLTGQLRHCEKRACLRLRANQIKSGPSGQALWQPRMLWLGAPLSRTSIWPTISWATPATRAW